MTLTSWIPTSSTPSSPSPSTGGSPGAARRLSRTRSAVSQSLSALEAALERGLFDRVDRRLALTREGLLAATPALRYSLRPLELLRGKPEADTLLGTAGGIAERSASASGEPARR